MVKKLCFEGKEVIPDIIVLDLNMPRINGIEFLRILKKDDYLKYIPAIILTTSNNHVLECYKTGLRLYLKPLKYEDYLNGLRDYRIWSGNE
jgi:CheY-like chemotaxis protein